MKEAQVGMDELQTRLLDRVPGLLTPGTLFSSVITNAAKIQREGDLSGSPEYLITSSDGTRLEIRLLNRIKHEPHEVPSSYLIQTSFHVPNCYPLYAFYGGDIGGGGFFIGDSPEIWIAGEDSSFKNRTTTQGLLLRFDTGVGQVNGLDGGKTMKPWNFSQAPSRVTLHLLGKNDYIAMDDIEGLNDPSSPIFGFRLGHKGNGEKFPVVLPKQLSVKN